MIPVRGKNWRIDIIRTPGTFLAKASEPDKFFQNIKLKPQSAFRKKWLFRRSKE